jgi:two-component system OmpR family sensor kinase
LAQPTDRLAATESVDLHDAVDDAMDSIGGAAWSRVDVRPAASATVRGDRVLLAVMLANAIENALKFSKGRVVVRIERSSDGWTRVSVEDDGPGVPEDERAKVFAPFVRSRAARASSVPGHGIGLSLIAHVAEVHGGRARFGDCATGARLEIELPGAPHEAA